MAENIHLCLYDLLDQDLTSYEYFQSLPKEIKSRVLRSDARSFAELQEIVEKIRKED